MIAKHMFTTHSEVMVACVMAACSTSAGHVHRRTWAKELLQAEVQQRLETTDWFGRTCACKRSGHQWHCSCQHLSWYSYATTGIATSAPRWPRRKRLCTPIAPGFSLSTSSPLASAPSEWIGQRNHSTWLEKRPLHQQHAQL